ncbi:MAG: A/G-specific adenine glycosylase [Bacteroidota bacterium]
MDRFSNILLKWYDENARELPWRMTNNPYFIWLSEIILQQTRVEQGMSYYFKFVKNFPTVFDLAKASEEEVLKNWQGLGYYSRARNLHSTARIVANELNGKFPQTYKELLKLKGIGPYTASAIASICFDEKTAVLDGNVFRFLSRYFDISTPIDNNQGKKEYQLIANSLISSDRPGDFNQGMMEMGARICKPKKWLCSSCPFQNSCLARKNKRIDQRPIKSKKLKVKERKISYLVCEWNSKLLFRKREHKDIWQGLYDFPEKHDHLDNLLGKENFSIINSPVPMTHILSHQKLLIEFQHVRIIDPSLIRLKGNWASKKVDSGLPLPRAIEKYLSDKMA